MQYWIWWVMQVNTSWCFIPTVSSKHKLLWTYSEENTWRFLFPRDFCMGENLLPGTWIKYQGSVKCRSAATGGQMGGLFFFGMNYLLSLQYNSLLKQPDRCSVFLKYTFQSAPHLKWRGKVSLPEDSALSTTFKLCGGGWGLLSAGTGWSHEKDTIQTNWVINTHWLWEWGAKQAQQLLSK